MSTSEPHDLTGDATISFEDIAKSPTVSDAILAIQVRFGLSFVTYHLARTVAGTMDSPFVRTTYPDMWVSRYVLKGYIEIDPIIREGFSRRVPFDWRELEFNPAAQSFLADAEAYGISGQGFSIPVFDKARRRGLLSVNGAIAWQEWDALVKRHRQEWIELAQIVHRIAMAERYGEHDPVPSLSRREVECLHWTALGKDQRDIAVILGLSEHTVRDYTKSARLKLGCATRSAAVTRAVYLGIIDPYSDKTPERGSI
ncbi:LuxR family transcriptional regulator [Pelagibacterium sp. H642]|uniref:LuxR family transcriptional regulator n=1 Tax=Pelagibacterium sp. H642 TaxID=1881069 RepID=UPI002815A366|nr:LuxR family transcriptional regulator [Pelagibacterium sp. H642]WMT92557.1 LuxR family transcriptional regulator [Pelagibacterium sp. H642]